MGEARNYLLNNLAELAIDHPRTALKKLSPYTFTLSISYDFFDIKEVKEYLDEKTEIWKQFISGDFEMPECPATEIRSLIIKSFEALGANMIYGGWSKNTFYISAENSLALAILLREKHANQSMVHAPF